MPFALFARSSPHIEDVARIAELLAVIHRTRVDPQCDTVDDMTDTSSGLPSKVDVERPNAARMYDYLLGGGANFDVDRAASNEMLAIFPDGAHYAQCNRSFLGRAVRFLTTEAGIDQFLDLGSGIPTVGNVHEVAHRYNANARVAYVDFEPVAVRHAQRLIGSESRVTITEADIRRPDTVLSALGVRELLDFSRPIGLLAVGVLPFVPGDEAATLMARYRDHLISGSYAAVSHLSRIGMTDEQLAAGLEIMKRTPTPEQERSPEEIRALLDGFTLLEPGVVPTPHWRPENQPSNDDIQRSNCYAAVGILP